MGEPLHPLANPVWHALAGPHAGFAQGTGSARRYHPDVAPFAALPDHPTDEDWAQLADLTAPDDPVALLRPQEPSVPAGWNVELRIAGVQLGIAPDVELPVPTADVELVELGPADAGEMLELVERTEPGPFRRRTVELGTYLGVRVDGALVAMAGHRFRTDGPDGGAVEISAVCTDPDHRGQGLGGALVIEQVEIIRGLGRLPIMHVARSNTVALSIYERLGFRALRTFEALILSPRP
jgi:ribosomal protein S18 acetylase RimI-like enzyme